MKIATILTLNQTLYFKYKDYSKLDLIVLKIKHPIEVLKEDLLKQGFILKPNTKSITEKEYYLFT